MRAMFQNVVLKRLRLLSQGKFANGYRLIVFFCYLVVKLDFMKREVVYSTPNREVEQGTSEYPQKASGRIQW